MHYFAVIKTGGKQYKVAAGDKFTVEKLTAEAGETVQFNEVLMLGGDETDRAAPGERVEHDVARRAGGEDARLHQALRESGKMREPAH